MWVFSLGDIKSLFGEKNRCKPVFSAFLGEKFGFWLFFPGFPPFSRENEFGGSFLLTYI